MSTRASSNIILSASRRTDIPAFYMDWFMHGIGQGVFEVINPYNGVRRQVMAGPHDVHSIVFWSKNFGPFLSGAYDRKLQEQGYKLFFNFTINPPVPSLEPHVPPLAERLAQIRELGRRHDPKSITWRFDPICFFRRNGHQGLEHNMDGLETIIAVMADAGIRRCITSFVDQYRKIKKRLPQAGLTLVEPPIEKKCQILKRMAAGLHQKQITLGACCEKAVLEALPVEAGVSTGDCIPGPLLASLYGKDFVLKRDPGQRRSSGCTCNMAVDIGSYRQQPCYHNCLFCYANPQAPPWQSKGASF